MLVSYLFDPALFKESNLSGYGKRQQLEALIKSVFLNGTVYLDKLGIVKKEIVSNIKQLPTHLSQNISILISELLKNRSFRVVEHETKNTISDDAVDVLYNLLVIPTLDCFLWAEETRTYFKERGINNSKALLVGDYFDSECEKLRVKFLCELPPIDTLSESSLADAISRAVRHSSRLKFFDKQIGKGNNTRHFRNGIKYILNIWRSTFQTHTQFAASECVIFTCPLHEIKADELPSEVERKKKENRIFINKVRSELVDPLRSEFGISIILRVKEDRQGIFHARFLVSEKISLSIERGFDLHTPSGTLHRNFIKVDNGCHGHISQCETLPEFA